MALAHSSDPRPAYRPALETLVERELEGGSPKEDRELQEGRVGVASLGRDVHASRPHAHHGRRRARAVLTLCLLGNPRPTVNGWGY